MNKIKRISKKYLPLLTFIAMLNIVIPSANAQWTAQSSGTTFGLNSVYFTDTNNGFAVGMYGTILYTNNAGAVWAAKSSGTTYSLKAVYFTDANNGFAVGYNGTVINTNDAGDIWTSQISGTTQNLNSVYFTDSNNGFTVGKNGIILRTTNAGANWVLQSSGSTINLNSIYFTDVNNGYAVGDSGTILKTNNAGLNWTKQTSGTIYQLNSVFFTSTDTGYTVGASGTILQTTNSGINWNVQQSGTNQWLNTVLFTDSKTGFVAGYSGTLLQTLNAGINWIPQPVIPYNWLNSLFITNNFTGFAVGESGTILHSKNLLTVLANKKDNSCNGSIDGDISIIPGCGIQPYTYLWSNGETTQNITNLPAGTYTLTLTDAVLSSKIFPYTIIEPQLILINIQKYFVTCNLEKTANVSFNVSGGTYPYNYSWSNGSTESFQYNLPVGKYFVTVTDKNNCLETDSFLLESPPIQSLPLYEDFTNTNINLDSLSWGNVVGPWVPIDVTGSDGKINKVMYENSWTIGTTSMAEFYSDPIVLSNATNPALSFDLSYSRYPGYEEYLQVSIIRKCNIDSLQTIIYDKHSDDMYGNSLSTCPEISVEFFPTSADQWRLENIDLSAFKQDTIIVYFFFFGSNGNNIFIDNIKIVDLPVETQKVKKQGDSLHFSKSGFDIVFSNVDTLQQADSMKITITNYKNIPDSIPAPDSIATLFNNDYWYINSAITNFNANFYTPYDTLKLNTGFINYLNMVYQEHSSKPWKLIDSIPFIVNNKIVFSTNHFSNWAIAITKPEAKAKADTSLTNATPDEFRFVKDFGNSGISLQTKLVPQESMTTSVYKYNINPGGDLPTEVLSFLNTFWEIKTNKTDTMGIYFDMDSVQGYKSADKDKYKILYRPDAITDWQVLPTMRVKKGLKEKTKVKNTNATGHYILAKTISSTLLFSDSASVQTACAGDSAIFTSYITNGTAPFTYQWSGEGNFSSSQQNPKHIYTSMGVFAYKLSVEDAGGAVTEFESTITIGCTNLEENLDEQIHIFPNPNSGKNLLIKLPDENSGTLNIKIFDMLGREVFTQEIIKTDHQNTYELQTSDLKNLKGGYFVVIDNGKRRYWKMVVVE